MKPTQTEIVVKILKESGRVTRNWALRTYTTSRLGAIICNLRKAGWNIDGRFERTHGGYGRGKDFVYVWRDWKPIHTQSLNKLQDSVI